MEGKADSEGMPNIYRRNKILKSPRIKKAKMIRGASVNVRNTKIIRLKHSNSNGNNNNNNNNNNIKGKKKSKKKCEYIRPH